MNEMEENCKEDDLQFNSAESIADEEQKILVVARTHESQRTNKKNIYW